MTFRARMHAPGGLFQPFLKIGDGFVEFVAFQVSEAEAESEYVELAGYGVTH